MVASTVNMTVRAKRDNRFLHRAKEAKKDEFYTQAGDVAAELEHYRHLFAGQVVYCNCDDGPNSAFVRWFAANFAQLNLKKLIATGYPVNDGAAHVLEMTAAGISRCEPLIFDGDFRSPECVDLLWDADIVVTNPPFSLFTEFCALLFNHHKQFLVVGNLNAITYRVVNERIVAGDVWLGVNNTEMTFAVPDSVDRWHYISDGTKYARLGNAVWFTNLRHNAGPEPMELTRRYDPELHHRFDDYDAINVNRTRDIPSGYDGIMGVPVSFLTKHNPGQFELVPAPAYAVTPRTEPDEFVLVAPEDVPKQRGLTVDDNEIYKRLWIRHRRSMVLSNG